MKFVEGLASTARDQSPPTDVENRLAVHSILAEVIVGFLLGGPYFCFLFDIDALARPEVFGIDLVNLKEAKDRTDREMNSITFEKLTSKTGSNNFSSTAWRFVIKPSDDTVLGSTCE